ncbi:382_t:CDS:2, partial [Ambispora leptoticha]
MNNRQQANTANTPRPPVGNYARVAKAAAQPKSKTVPQSQLQQTQPQRQTQHPTQNNNTQQQQTAAAAGHLSNHGSSLNGKYNSRLALLSPQTQM